HSTARAALGYAAGVAPKALVSVRAAALLEGGLQAMAMVKLKTAITIVLLLAVLGVSAGAWMRLVVAGTPHAPAEAKLAGDEGEKTAPPSGAHESRQQLTFSGRVLDSEGKPVAGASLSLFGEGTVGREVGVSGANGEFAFALPKGRLNQFLVAR